MADQKDPTDLYGKFDISEGVMFAYGPAGPDEERCWKVVFEKNGEEVHSDKLEMFFEPIFGYDAGDVAYLNQRIEELIKEWGLE